MHADELEGKAVKGLLNPTTRSIHVELKSGEVLTIEPMQVVRVPADEQVVRAIYLGA